MSSAVAVPEIVLVDTDVYSFLLNGRGPKIDAYRRHLHKKHMALAFITIGELYFGAYRKNWGPARLEALKESLRPVAIVPYDLEVCKRYAEIKAELESKGKRIEDNDLWIAACAIRHSIPLVSHNWSDFERVPGLVLISENRSLAEVASQTKLEIDAISPEPPSSQSETSS